MKIILSPAKKMNIDEDSLQYVGNPVFQKEREEILSCLKSLSREELKKVWNCSEKLVDENIQRLESMDFVYERTPAVIAYDGIAYKYMAPAVFEYEHLDYVQEHLRILSGFYGVLKPMDGVMPYRLEMQAKLKVGEAKNLYEFWGRKIFDEVVDESGVIINLASKEYSKCVEKYLTKSQQFITCSFVEDNGGKLKTKGTYAKMARGEMVRFMAENKVEDPKDLRNFDRLGYRYRGDLSSETEYVFERIVSLKLG